jgi:glycerol-3-phosphate dehydrogenase
VWELKRAVDGASLVIVSVPSQVVGPLARDISPLIKRGQVVLNVAKGLEAGTHLRLSQVLERELGKAFRTPAGSMGGPAIAIEMARGVPMAVIIGMADRDSGLRVQRILQNEHLKVETTADVCGVELCATLKNVYAMALGVCDGLGFGTNTKAFLATLALAEMREISSVRMTSILPSSTARRSASRPGRSMLVPDRAKSGNSTNEGWSVPAEIPPPLAVSIQAPELVSKPTNVPALV